LEAALADTAAGFETEKSRFNVPFRSDWLGKARSIYRPERWAPANLIKVSESRVILIWPLVQKIDASALGDDPQVNPAGQGLELAVKALENHKSADGEKAWQEVPDLRDHLQPPNGDDERQRLDDAARYAEFVYFYDFLQSILFSSKDTLSENEQPIIRLFRRMDVKSAEIWLSAQKKVVAAIDRCNLYLFATGAAAFVLEVDFRGVVEGELETGDGTPKGFERLDSRSYSPLMLSDVQTVIDRLRRTYVPYYDKDHEPGGMPYRLIYLDEDCNPLTLAGDASDADRRNVGKQMELAEAEAVIMRAGQERTAPTDEAWRALLAPLRLHGYEDASSNGPVWRHVVDERIPMMSFVSLTGADAYLSGTAGAAHINHSVTPAEVALPEQRDFYLLSRGDWVRLCNGDTSGTDPLPYAPAFLADFESCHCYDRFVASDATDSASRTMFAGYHTCFAGAGWYFDKLISHHFRRHYFQMALVLTMEHASLLALSSRISALVREFKGKPEASRDPIAQKKFRKGIVDVQKEFLDFVHIYRFTGVSNQIQPMEMFTLWRRSLGLDQMFADVKQELEAAGAFALATEQADQSEAANRLSIVATLGVVAGLIVAALSMNFVLDKDLLKDLFVVDNAVPPWREVFMHLFVGLGMVSVVTAIALHLMLWLNKPPFDRETEQILKVLRVTKRWAASLFLVSVLAAVAMAVAAT
jgi:hypothetical protein